MADKFLDVYEGGPELNFMTFWNQSKVVDTQARPFAFLFRADPILTIFCSYHRRAKVTRYHIRVIDKPLLELTTRNKNPYFMGFAIISNLLRKRAKKRFNRNFPTWRRRRSVTVHGDWTAVNPLNYTISSFMSTLVLPTAHGGIGNVVVDLARYNSTSGLVDHLSFDGLRRLATRLLPFDGMTFQRNDTLGRYVTHQLVGLSVSDSTITYTLKGYFQQSYPSSRTVRATSIGVKIERMGDLFGGNSARISVTGLNNVIFDNNVSLGNMSSFTAQAAGFYLTNSIKSRWVEDQWRDLAKQVFHIPLASFAPGLYHTGSKALTDCLIDYSKNFENFVELPQLVSMWHDAAEVISKQKYDIMPEIVSRPRDGSLGHVTQLPVKKGLYRGNALWKWISDPFITPITRVKRLALVFSGAHLAFAFALRPTYDSVVEAANAFTLPMKGESSFKLTLETMPQSLRELVLPTRHLVALGTTYDKVKQFDVTFRSEVNVAPDYQALAQAFLNANPLVSLGILPTPSGVWAIGEMTFVIDWFLGITRLIEDATTYIRAPFIPYRVGHTVRIVIRLQDGRSFDAFYRSRETDHILNPPSDSWLPVQGVQSTAIPLAIQKLFGGR